MTPVTHARPEISGMIAGRPPTVVSAAIRPWKAEPMTERMVIVSPTVASPRA